MAAGAPIGPAYVEHIELCLACRGCESACPSGVQYGRLVEAARARNRRRRGAHAQGRAHAALCLRAPFAIARHHDFVAGTLLYLYQGSGLQKMVRALGFLKLLGKLGEVEQLAPPAEPPFFFNKIGKTFPAEGQRRHKVALMAGCIANVCFARLNEATVRVLRKNGCEVAVPGGQGCCGALHVHAGLRDQARTLARRNIDALAEGGYDAILDQRGRLRLDPQRIRRTIARRPGVRRAGARVCGSMSGMSPSFWRLSNSAPG